MPQPSLFQKIIYIAKVLFERSFPELKNAVGQPLKKITVVGNDDQRSVILQEGIF